MPITLTAELNETLQTVKKQLPAGFDIVETEQLNQLINERATLLAVFATFKPILTGLSGTGEQQDVMGLISKIGPLIPQLQSNKELQENISKALNFV